MTLSRPSRALRRQAAIADLRRRERIAIALDDRARARAFTRQVESLRMDRLVRERLARAGLDDFTFHPAPTPEGTPS